MNDASHLKKHRWTVGDPRASEAAKRPREANRTKLLKKLKTFDDAAWETFGRLFASAEPQHALEALKIWAKYRLHVLTIPANTSATPELPKMSPDFAKRIMEALDS
jgi:hypothetical protein